ncbi:MAG TPA: 1-acyl-sn-glycerol-3-phosphate acyltransferase [Myxococcota bacterium]|nr:1-acyl-sn-glycerol-3-phosphate acyltransferase [Myxococcota bacterium]
MQAEVTPTVSARPDAAPPVSAPPEVIADPRSAMTPRFQLFFRWFAKRYFRHLQLDDATVARLRALEARGSVVYVMRYASRLDYFLFNALFARQGLRLSGFANSIGFWYYRPVAAALRAWARARREERAEGDASGLERRRARGLVEAGQSLFLFLRTERLREQLRGREAAVEQLSRQRDLLSEVVDVAASGRPVFLVPIALFWRKGPRTARRVLNLAYGAPTRPSDVAKVTGFLIAYRSLAINVGEAIDLTAFANERRAEGADAVVRKVRRSMLLFLYREERVVEGPALRPRHRVQEIVLQHPAVAAAIERHAVERRKTPEAARAEAESIFREIAAHMNSTLLALLNFAVTAVFKRLFSKIDEVGLDKVASYAKRHPVVLVPSHRSYFDFLVLSWLFYAHHLVPPHIAARENMGFGPFGYIFRRAGAFFLRARFDDPLYKEIFRRYLAYLVKEGFTQEFFIEGGRSRTGKTLSPRLGMLAWNLEAFVASQRRDLFFVPVAISYERLVEEGSMIEELEGGEKKPESMLGLMRARRVLRRRFGSVFVNFGEPISLAAALGGRSHLFAPERSEDDPERRALVERLGNELAERINWAVVANSTSVVAAAFLGEARRGLFRAELVARVREVLELLRLQDVRLTPALAAAEPDYAEAIDFMRRADLIESAQDPRGELLYYEESRRRALDVYRNALFHYLAAPSFLARRLLRGAREDQLRDDLAFWLDLFYTEFFVPKGTILGFQLDAFLDYFERIGTLERRDDALAVTEKGRPYFAFLAEQTLGLLESYYATFSALLAAPGPLSRKQLEKQAASQFERAALLGEVRRPEGANPVTVANAVELLARRGVLAVRASERGERTYARGPSFDELAALRERLAAALTSR